MGHSEDTKRVFFPFMTGESTRQHPYALESPGLESCINASFARPGAIGKRRAYTSIGVNILGGGTLSNIRKIVAHGDELLCFTSTELYSWSAGLSKWVLKGDHLAIKTTERTRFVSAAEQILCDRAELGGVIVYSWTESGDDLYIAAIDKTTGTVILAPTAQGSAASVPKGRLVALTNVIMLIADMGTNALKIKALDVTDLATGAAAAFTSVSTTHNGYFDVVSFSSTQVVIAHRDTTQTQYKVFVVGEDEVTDDSVTVARTCNGPISVAVEANSSTVAIVRAVTAGTAIKGDLLDSVLDDTAHVDKAVGTFTTTCNQIASAFRTVQDSSEYRCYSFWSSNETTVDFTPFGSDFNYLDTGGSLGTEASFVSRVGITSRAFDVGGTVYVWGAFSAQSSDTFAQLQNTYFMYNDAGTLCAKASGQISGGFSQEVGTLPGVQSLGSNQYATCGTIRRIIPLGGEQKGYAARSPRDIVFEFDSDDARRTAMIGDTVYIAGAHILQYDGEGVAELGFHIFPWQMGVTDITNTGGVPDGTLTWIGTYAWENARGEIDRSTTATFHSLTMSGGAPGSDALITGAGCPVTLKQGTRSAPAMEYWRTQVNPPLEAPFYLVTSKDPTATGANGYLESDTTDSMATFTDSFSDDTLDDKETFRENGSILENLAPPPASIIAAGMGRVFIAGTAGNALDFVYSKLRLEGEVAAFHDALRVSMPSDGGDITGIGVLHETLIVFKETAIYALDGQGIDNAGQGENYSPRLIATDVGAQSHDTIAVIPQGLFFKSSKGWYVLPSSGQIPRYVGGAVSEYDSDTFVAVHALPEEHLILCVSTSRTLAFDYLAAGGEGAWSVWNEASQVSATVWNGVHLIATATAVKDQDADKTATAFATDIKTSPIRIGGPMGYGVIKDIQILGRYKGAHTFQVYLYRDYSSTPFETVSWTVSPTTIDEPLQIGISPSIQKMEALQVRITDQYWNAGAAPVGDTFELNGIELLVEDKGGLFRLPSTQRAGGNEDA